ncbi:3'-5' exonuclease [Serratia ureilytica]|uniref:3'-5' exonuclease n=1 Tax=Serratia ureilytica TaxID=300181 RepID=UPI0018D7E529|nr:3'-5' exoribonuclease [Serratia ureilytica]
MKNLMLDLETLGKKPSAPILTIGAVLFDPRTGELGEQFYTAVDLQSVMAGKATPDADTIIWWMKQSSEARAAICVEGAPSLLSALYDLNKFIRANVANPRSLRVWGNGAVFDNVILRESYQRECVPLPWEWYNDRDVRTIVELGREVGFDPKRDMPFDGEHHNALADAIHQAKYVSAIYQHLFTGHQQD